MSFLLPCPNCGPRDVNEFTCAGEVTVRPKGSPSLRELCEYVYFRRNVAGIQREWWYHRFGCEVWFQAERDTRTNEVLLTEVVDPAARQGTAGPQEATIPDSPAV
jgi:heterotetrameric sarcosine oxidase delta subunit